MPDLGLRDQVEQAVGHAETGRGGSAPGRSGRRGRGRGRRRAGSGRLTGDVARSAVASTPMSIARDRTKLRKAGGGVSASRSAASFDRTSGCVDSDTIGTSPSFGDRRIGDPSRLGGDLTQRSRRRRENSGRGAEDRGQKTEDRMDFPSCPLPSALCPLPSALCLRLRVLCVRSPGGSTEGPIAQDRSGWTD